MRVLLLSAYDAPSHRRWREGLVQHLEVDWVVEVLPPRHFAWRARGNPLTWFRKIRDLFRDLPIDLVLCTSMVDLSALRGLVPAMTRVPNIVYFHENQFAYPVQGGKVDPSLCLLNTYTALAADTVVFNTEFNRTSMMDGVTQWLKKMRVLDPEDIVDELTKKSTVIPVGISPIGPLAVHKTATEPVRLIWNHRWEHDKGPDRLFLCLEALERRQIDFAIDVVGQSFRTVPSCFHDAKTRWASRIRHWGYLPREDYETALMEADFVLSTALHEFQGLSVLEAMSAHCIPVVPDRLAYTETVPPEGRYTSHLTDPAREAECMADKIASLLTDNEALAVRSKTLAARYDWDTVIGDYQALFITGLAPERGTGDALETR